MKNSLTWYEIPTQDLERAKNFYAQIFSAEFEYVPMPDAPMYMFNVNQEAGQIGGALVHTTDNVPSKTGTIVYFSCEDVAHEAQKVEQAGGQVVVPKTSLGEFGFMAIFIDSEGNRVGLHSMQ
jgi:uncharacterized protein